MASGTKPYPPIVLGFFARGLHTNRQPLFSALTGVGLQVIQFKDYLIDGVNVECSDKFTFQRAPGFVKYCSAQLAVAEKVNQFYDTRDLSGNVYTLADTNQNLYKITPSALTSLLTKGTTAQGHIQKVGGVTYYANGTDLKKWLPPAASMAPWGIAAPMIRPSVSSGGMFIGTAFWTPSINMSGTRSALLDSNGNVQFQSALLGGLTNPIRIPLWPTPLGSATADGTITWKNVGPIGSWAASTSQANPTVILDSNSNLQLVTTAGTTGATVPAWATSNGFTTTDGTVTWTNIAAGIVQAYSGYSYVYAYRTVTGNLSTASPALNTGPILVASLSPVTVTAWSITSSVLTMTAVNNLKGGQEVEFGGFAVSTFFNGTFGVVLTATPTQFTASYVHVNGSGTEAGLASPVIVQLQGASSANPECSASATITNIQVAAGVVTLTAPNNFTPGINVHFAGVGTAVFLNGLILQVSSATPTSFTVSLPNQANYGPAADTGLAVFLAVEIYRTKDGGGVYYFNAAVFNGGTWIFDDITQDSELATQLVAPLARQNDPPPAGGTLLAWWSNRIWMTVGNKLYFDGGPDTLNGIAEECWPPGNVFVFPGTIGALNATTGGLVVTIPEEVWAIVGGPQTFAYYPERILSHFGALSPNCVRQDGDTLFIYSSQKQLTVLSGAGKIELGAGNSGVSPVGDILANGMSTLSLTASIWPADTSYLTIHRQGEDSGIYLSNGVESIIRYGLNVGNFSPVRQPFVTGAAISGPINSVETSPGQYSLLFSPATTHDYIYARSLTIFSDNGHGYPSNFVVGNIVVTEPGQPLAPLYYITAYLFNRGSVPQVGFIPNDITPAAFINLPIVQPEPAFLPAPVNLMSKRWPVIMNQTSTPLLIRHLQVKMDFGATDTVKNELIELALRFENEQLL